jgi:exosortase
VASVIGRDESSHGLFVPFISAFFLWQKRDKIKKAAPEFALFPGSLFIMVSLAMLLAPENIIYSMLSAASFFVMAAGLILIFFGRQIFKEVRSPLFFLMTMIPLPEPLYRCVAEWMRFINTNNAVFVTQLFGIPFERNGYYLQFPDILLSVNESCSGIRYLISYFVFGLAYAFFYKKSIVSRILVIAAIIPISIFAGSMRLSAIFLAVYYIGAWTTDRIPHNFLSWIVFCVILTAAIWTDWKLSHYYEGLPAKKAKS